MCTAPRRRLAPAISASTRRRRRGCSSSTVWSPSSRRLEGGWPASGCSVRIASRHMMHAHGAPHTPPLPARGGEVEQAALPACSVEQVVVHLAVLHVVDRMLAAALVVECQVGRAVAVVIERLFDLPLLADGAERMGSGHLAVIDVVEHVLEGVAGRTAGDQVGGTVVREVADAGDLPVEADGAEIGGARGIGGFQTGPRAAIADRIDAVD